MEETWTREIQVGEERFELHFVRRAFREGLEVRVNVRGKEISLAELGFGERALIERARARIEAELQSIP